MDPIKENVILDAFANIQFPYFAVDLTIIKDQILKHGFRPDTYVYLGMSDIVDPEKRMFARSGFRSLIKQVEVPEILVEYFANSDLQSEIRSEKLSAKQQFESEQNHFLVSGDDILIEFLIVAERVEGVDAKQNLQLSDFFLYICYSLQTSIERSNYVGAELSYRNKDRVNSDRANPGRVQVT